MQEAVRRESSSFQNQKSESTVLQTGFRPFPQHPKLLTTPVNYRNACSIATSRRSVSEGAAQRLRRFSRGALTGHLEKFKLLVLLIEKC